MSEPHWLAIVRMMAEHWRTRSYTEEFPMPVAAWCALKLLAHVDALHAGVRNLTYYDTDESWAHIRALLDNDEPPEVKR